MNTMYERPAITQTEIIEVLKEVRQHEERDLSQIYAVSVQEEGRVCHIAAHLPLYKGVHLYYLVTIDRGLFNRIIFEDSNVIDSIHTKTAQDAKERATNYLRHILSLMK